MDISTISSPNFSSRNGCVPEIIVYHIADGTFEGTKAWFLNPGSQVSSHYLVSKKGEVCQCVPLQKAAWCNGTNNDTARNSTSEIVKVNGGNANSYSVSIEFEGFYTETKGELTKEQLDTAVELTELISYYVFEVYGTSIPYNRHHLIGHNEVSPLTRPNCPGEKFPWDRLLGILNKDISTYVVQVGAFKDYTRARHFINTSVCSRDLVASISTDIDTGLYKVQVGSFKYKENATKFKQEVESLGLDAFIYTKQY